MKKLYEVFIAGNVPSSKNSKQIGRLFNGRRILRNSTLVENYIENTTLQYIKESKKFREAVNNLPLPVHIGLKFVRNNRHKFDYNNCSQICFDLMKDKTIKIKQGKEEKIYTTYCFIPDDNADVVIPYYFPYEYNKDCPGVYISILLPNIPIK